MTATASRATGVNPVACQRVSRARGWRREQASTDTYRAAREQCRCMVRRPGLQVWAPRHAPQ
eukprot:5060969-Prymnesium_polylepis.1